MKWLTLLLLIVLLPAVISAQTPRATKSRPKPPAFTSAPHIEDRELYYSFFQYHQTLINAQQAAKTANPQNATQLDQQMATLLHVDVKELPVVNANIQQVTTSHASVLAGKTQAAAALATAPANVTQPSASQSNAEYELTRARITAGGVLYLFQSLSPASWAGLHAYITGPYKTTVYKH